MSRAVRVPLPVSTVTGHPSTDREVDAILEDVRRLPPSDRLRLAAHLIEHDRTHLAASIVWSVASDLEDRILAGAR